MTFICRNCAEIFSLNEARWQCDCGGLLDIDFRPTFDLEAISRRPPTLWRYQEALPLADPVNAISFDEGFTPLTAVDFAGRKVWVKQDHLFLTGSFKDRGAAMLISKANELGLSAVVEDSSGNAGCAIAAYCAKANIICDIYVPEETSAGKLAQIQHYGAKLNKIPGSRAATAEAVLSAAQNTYYASHSWNPFFFHGTKTFAYEVCEQLGWQAPDTVILPVGNGTLFLGAFIGFKELHQAGIISHIPKLIGVQAEACAPLVFAEQLDDPLYTLPTLAEGIAITNPIRGPQILEAIGESGGHFITVSEAQIKDSLMAMGKQGYYIEPTSAATTAGVSKYVAIAPADEMIVSVFTGHGLKATEKMMKL